MSCAERQFYDLQGQYAVAQVAEAEQVVRLYKNLGGGGQNYQSIPAIRQPQPAIVAAFRRLLSIDSVKPVLHLSPLRDI